MSKTSNGNPAQLPSLSRQQGCWMGEGAVEQEKAEGTRCLDFRKAWDTLHM